MPDTEKQYGWLPPPVTKKVAEAMPQFVAAFEMLCAGLVRDIEEIERLKAAVAERDQTIDALLTRLSEVRQGRADA